MTQMVSNKEHRLGFAHSGLIIDAMALLMLNTYRISSYSFRGNYSFLNLEIQRSQYIRAKVTVHKGAETLEGQQLYEEIRYL